MIEVYFDGGCRPTNPGKYAAFGYVVKKGEEILAAGSGIVEGKVNERMTNNIGEYTGLIEALKNLKKLDEENEFNLDVDSNEDILVKGDSALIINQVTGKFKTKSSHLKKLRAEVMSLLGELGSHRVEFEWIDRKENKDADSLVSEKFKEMGL